MAQSANGLAVEMWPIDRLVAYARNPRAIPPAAVDKVAASIREFGWRVPVVVDKDGTIIAGHTRIQAARKLGLEAVPVHVAHDLTPQQAKAYRLADNRVAQDAQWNKELLGFELKDLADLAYDLELTGFDAGELEALLAPEASGAVEGEDDVPEPPKEPVTLPGDLWLCGEHRVICGDARSFGDYERLLDGGRANVAFTSPPYASQRAYDPSSGFRPIRPDEYVEWFRDVAANIAAVLAEDGSYFLNIKEHCEDGQRHLYVKDLTIAHVRQWGWRFVDELCWTRQGVPGGWPNRFKNGWEPVFHFCRVAGIKFRPESVGHASDDVIDYAPTNPKARSGSGLLRNPGTGHDGIARPNNVLNIPTGGGRTSTEHSAGFPVALPAWFLRAFSDPGDIVLDPFMGSGSTLIAAECERRRAAGLEISPAYCDVIVRRWQTLTGQRAALDGDGRAFDEVAGERVPQAAA